MCIRDSPKRRAPTGRLAAVITATDLELRAGSRILLSGASLRVQPGDRIGLVGRNGAGKTTTLRVLAGESTPHAGDSSRAREVMAQLVRSSPRLALGPRVGWKIE